MADEKLYHWSYKPHEIDNEVNKQSLVKFDQIIINDDAI